MSILIIIILFFPLFLLPWLAVLHAAYYKGVHVPSAGAVGFFGTPLMGILYVIAMPSDPVKLKRRRLRNARATDKECSHCLSLIPKQAAICHQCGRNTEILPSLKKAKLNRERAPETPPQAAEKPPEPAPIPEGSFNYVEHGGTDTQAAEAYKQRIQDASR